MPRYRYDKEMDCIVEIRDGANYPEPEKRVAPMGVISDLEPYKAVASDVALNGAQPVIGGRRQHREFLQRNGYVEVGNETSPTRSDAPSSREAQANRVNDIKRALGEYGSDTGRRH